MKINLQFSVENNNLDIYSKDVVIFASENEDIVNNWLSVINYFIQRP
jgi:hypothetical protein